MHRCTALFVVLVLILTGSTAGGEQPWEHVEHTDGVDVYQRDAQQFGAVAFRGVIELDIPIGEVIPVFIDPDERPNWVYRHAEEEMLERDEVRELAWSERSWVRVDMPFPATDRDYIFHTEYEFHPDDRSVTADLRTVDDVRMPPQDCCVRAESITHYTVEALPEERTRIEVASETDLGGQLPDWITRRAEREWPVETLTALAERIRRLDVEPDDRVEGWHDAPDDPEAGAHHHILRAP